MVRWSRRARHRAALVTASVSAPCHRARSGIVKRYGRTVALDGVDLTVGRGELVGLLGTETARARRPPSSCCSGWPGRHPGSGRVLGAPLGDRATRQRIGCLPELFRYQPWLRRPRGPAAPHAELAGIQPPRDRARAASGCPGACRPGPTARSNTVSGFSKGMQQRLGLGVALLGAPDLVLLDEPTSALDPGGPVSRFARSSGPPVDRGATVILNSHLLTEVERVCDRVIIVHHGRIVAAGTLDLVLAGDGVRIQASGLDAGSLAPRSRRSARCRTTASGSPLPATPRRSGPEVMSPRSWPPAGGSTPWSRGVAGWRRGSWS